MKFVIVDLETTGIDTELDQILQVSMIAVDTHKPPSTWTMLDTYVQHERYSGNVYALALNAKIIKKLNEYTNGNFNDSHMVTHIDNLALTIFTFLLQNDWKKDKNNDKVDVVFSGKSIGSFDIPFLKNVPGFNELIKVHKRHLDPTILYTDFINDVLPPALEECKKRAGLPELVSHDAIEDCWDVAKLILHKMGWDLSSHIDNCTEFGTTYNRVSGIELDEIHLLYLNDLKEAQNPFTRYSVVNRITGVGHYVWSKKELENLN